MHKRTQDAFCYVRKYGRPDLFITFTANPQQIETSELLFPSQASHDRHDIITRVLNLKVKLLIDLINKEKIFGSFFIEIEMDNKLVVPDSPVLSRTFQAHINVEVCNSVQSINK